MGRQHLSLTRWYMRHNCLKNTQHTSKQGGNRTSALPCSCWHTWRAKSSLAPAEGEQGLGSGAGMRWSCSVPDTPTESGISGHSSSHQPSPSSSHTSGPSPPLPHTPPDSIKQGHPFPYCSNCNVPGTWKNNPFIYQQNVPLAIIFEQ